MLKAIHGLLDSPKKRTKLTILSKEDAEESEFCLILEALGTPYCFQDSLTFSPKLFFADTYLHYVLSYSNQGGDYAHHIRLSGAVEGKTGKTLVSPGFSKIELGGCSGDTLQCYGGLARNVPAEPLRLVPT